MKILDNGLKKYQKVDYNLPCTKGAWLSLTECVSLPQIITLQKKQYMTYITSGY